jgi:hypothetical protein
MLFDASQVALILVALTPLRFWASFAPRPNALPA